MRVIFALMLLSSIVLNESLVHVSLIFKEDGIIMDFQKDSKSEKEQKETLDEEVRLTLNLYSWDALSEEDTPGRISPSYFLEVYAQPIIDFHSPPPKLI